jgi:hypothetical protein
VGRQAWRYYGNILIHDLHDEKEVANRARRKAQLEERSQGCVDAIEKQVYEGDGFYEGGDERVVGCD